MTTKANGPCRFLSGVVEGFYGRPWTMEQRERLFYQMNQLGLNSYMYAPKDDEKHRAIWRALYWINEADGIARLIQACKINNVEFIYAIAPGLDMTFSSHKEMDLLKAKLDQVAAFGCKAFALLFDDIEADMCDVDGQTFESFAHAQVFVANTLYEHLHRPSTFLFCPTEYSANRAVPNVAKSSYLHTLGKDLHPDIGVLWTGPKVVSKLISVASIQAVSAVLHRPPVIWDNLHANDYDQRRLFLGPYQGRPLALRHHVRGVLTNPNCEFEANFVAVHTLARWCSLPLPETDQPEGDAMSTDPPVSEEGNLLAVDGNHSPCSVQMEDARSDSGVGCMPSDASEAGIRRRENREVDDDSNAESDGEAADQMESDPNLYSPPKVLQDTLQKWLAEFHRPCNVNLQPAATGTDRPISTATASVSTPPLLPVTLSSASSRKSEPFSLAQLQLLADLFYLPYEHGERGWSLIEQFSWLRRFYTWCANSKASAREGEEAAEPMDASEVSEGGGEQRQEVASVHECGQLGKGEEMTTETPVGRESLAMDRRTEWLVIAEEFHQKCASIQNMFTSLSEIPNRPLLYDLYSYAWDVKEIVSVLDSFISWLATSENAKSAAEFFSDGDDELWVFRGGISAALQRLLPEVDGPSPLLGDDGRGSGLPEDHSIFTIRPYLPADEAAMYRVCLETADSGQDGTRLFPHYPDLIGHRFVGPYSNLSAEFAYVLEDDSGVCGYTLGALDSRFFYDRFCSEWLPLIRSKYQAAIADPSDLSDAEKEILTMFVSDDWRPFLPEDLYDSYPSHLHIDIVPRGQGKGLGRRMVKCLLSALKAKGSRGVHLEASAENHRAISFYKKLGFSEPVLPNGPPEGCVILVRTL